VEERAQLRDWYILAKSLTLEAELAAAQFEPERGLPRYSRR
jgi:hypothetical protein